MRKFVGILCMLVGIAMLAGAVWLLYENGNEEKAAGASSETLLETLKAEIRSEGQPASAEVMLLPDMPEIEIDGQMCVGYLEMPTIDIYLPVISEWSYPKLKVAPCRYWGNVYDDTMVIMAHNYARHFGGIATLQMGDPVQFIDAQGNIFQYVVAAQEVLERFDVDSMVSGEYALTLFTCTYGGAKRVTVHLNRVLAY